MLTHLSVQDLAIVDNVELELAAGVTALTGETGAGKSLIIDALQLAIGARASADVVRAGASAAHVTAVFEPSPAVRDWLLEHALDDDDACVLRRVVGADGRSRAFINARPVPVSQLKDLGEHLVDVHGQHSHQALLKGPAQRDLLDGFVAEPGVVADVAAAYETISRLDAEIADLGGDAGDPHGRLDFIRYQLEELRAAPIAPQALDAIEKEHRTLAHTAEILSGVAAARDALDDDDDGAARRLATAIHALDAVAGFDRRVDGLQQSLRDCASLLQDADSALRHFADGLETNDGRLQELDAALASIHDLARKHRVQERDLHARQLELEAECERIEGSAMRLAQAARERDAATAHFASRADELHRLRVNAAAQIAAAVNEVLATLGMDGAAIEFQVQRAEDAAPARHGLDRVTLLARTNPGQSPLPLARIASGGELSRIALAVHAVALDEGGAATVVFDEVDAGVGGAVAEILGRRIRALGEHRQVLTVTHLPQVAALAHHHAVVSKHTDSAGARSRLKALDRAEREQELARMLGGVTVTRRTLEHAREMLDATDGPAPRGRRQGPRRPAA